MTSPIYERLRETAARTAREIGLPSFYRSCSMELELSRSSFAGNSLVRGLLASIDRSTLHPAHGMDHGEKVAIEAGAILARESGKAQSPHYGDGLMLCAHVAGLLHDIKRREKDHPVTGSIEAGRILKEAGLDETHRRYITAAIRNHEAFKDVLESEDDSALLISNALYDADKFRWGPENFTTTMWLIMESSGTPAEALYRSFDEKIGWIKRIRNTFRTTTGKKYGPEFIDLGIQIGSAIYADMDMIMGNR